MKFDLILNYEDTKARSNEDILSMLNVLFPNRKLYSFSLSWREDRQYILKAKGQCGDVIATWEDI